MGRLLCGLPSLGGCKRSDSYPDSDSYSDKGSEVGNAAPCGPLTPLGASPSGANSSATMDASQGSSSSSEASEVVRMSKSSGELNGSTDACSIQGAELSRQPKRVTGVRDIVVNTAALC